MSQLENANCEEWLMIKDFQIDNTRNVTAIEIRT